MAGPAYTNFAPVTGGETVVAISRTAAIFVAQTGVVQVAGVDGVMQNFGTVQAGAEIKIEVHAVGTLTTAGLIALR